MTSQIFKEKIPNSLLFEILDKICLKNEKHYTLNTIAFKKGVFNEDIPKFMESCIPYYFLSKRNYLTRKLTYNTFTTVIRQICNYNHITYTSQIKYDKSNYEILYYIYF